MIIVLTTYPTDQNVEEIAKRIVASGLAACVNIIRSEKSVYRWKGQIESNAEFILLIKTSTKAYPKLEAMIKETYPYKLPEIVYLEVKGGVKNYLDWVDGNSNGISRLLSVPLHWRDTKRADEPSKELTNAKKPKTLSI